MMSEGDREAETPAPGNWRVTAKPYSAVAAPTGGAPAAVSLTAQAMPGSAPAAAPARPGGRPLVAALICAGVLLLWFVGGDSIHPQSGGGVAYSVGVATAGAFFGAVLWAIAFAITIRKGSKGWKLGSLIGLAMVGALVALSKVGAPDVAAPVPPVQVPIVPTGK
jgi:hypothetical protein